MYTLPILSLLLLSCHLTVFALTLPLIITNLTADWTSPSAGYQDSEAHCATQRPRTPPLPLSSDCIEAIRFLPNDDYIGTFHIGGDSSHWRLPDSRSFDSCTVSVTLHEDFELEMGSWLDVGNGATRLLLACRLPFERSGEQRTGGWIASGAENGLVVQLVRSRNVPMNGTGVRVQRDRTAVSVE